MKYDGEVVSVEFHTDGCKITLTNVLRRRANICVASYCGPMSFIMPSNRKRAFEVGRRVEVTVTPKGKP